MFDFTPEALGKAGLVTILVSFMLFILWDFIKQARKTTTEQANLLTQERSELKIGLAEAKKQIAENAIKCQEEHKALNEYIRNRLTQLLEDNANFNHAMVKAQIEYSSEIRELKKYVGELGKIK